MLGLTNTIELRYNSNMKQSYKIFAQEYLVDRNGTRAMIRAGYSKHTAAEQASRMLKRPEVKAYIQKLKDKRSKRTEITADNVLAQYRNLAFADINDYYHIEYQMRFLHSTVEKTIRKRELLQKYIGYIIQEDLYNTLSKAHKNFYLPQKVLKPFDLLTKEQRAAIACITYDKHGNPLLKLSSKETSLDALAKHLGIFEKDNNQKSTKIKVEQRTLNDFYS